MVRALLCEAANVMMTRCRADNWLKSWGLIVAAARSAQGEGSPGSASCRHNASDVGRWNRLLHGKADANDRLTLFTTHATADRSVKPADDEKPQEDAVDVDLAMPRSFATRWRCVRWSRQLHRFPNKRRPRLPEIHI
jgi:hypothetical protein